MPLIVEDEGIELWIYIYDDQEQVHCFRDDAEVIIGLETLFIIAYTADLPSGCFLNKALWLVQKHHAMLRQNGAN